MTNPAAQLPSDAGDHIDIEKGESIAMISAIVNGTPNLTPLQPPAKLHALDQQ